jgi:hypothetical protein
MHVPSSLLSSFVTLFVTSDGPRPRSYLPVLPPAYTTTSGGPLPSAAVVRLQRGRRTSASHGAFSAAEPSGQVLHESGRRLLHGREVDVAGVLHLSTLDFQPRKPLVPLDGCDGNSGGTGKPAVA